MAAAITKAITKTMPIQDTMAMNMNMEDLLVVTVVVVVAVVMLGFCRQFKNEADCHAHDHETCGWDDSRGCHSY
jgi:hypothetical protein